MSYKQLIHIPNLKVHNANALSSPYTIGVPAMPAWLGFMHKVERTLHEQNLTDIKLESIGIAYHDVNLQTLTSDKGFEASLIGRANPLNKDGNRPSFIAEGRCHLTVSILIEYTRPLLVKPDTTLVHTIKDIVMRLKVAGGDVISVDTPKLDFIDLEDDQSTKKLMSAFMPSYFLIERRDLMQKAMESQHDALDVLLDHLAIHHKSETLTEVDKDTNEETLTINWTSQRLTPGWLVPIATGFHAISPLGHAQNQRDENYPHRFAESVLTLGEFIMPYRVKNLDSILWKYHVDLNHGLYLCQTNLPQPQ